MKSAQRVAVVAVLALLLSTLGGSAGAQPPTGEVEGPGGIGVAGAVGRLLQYQGRLTQPGTGDPVPDGSYPMSFRLYDAETGGSSLWSETKNVPVAGGLFSTVLGDATPLDPYLFDGQELWLGIVVGEDDEASPRQPILPVAYAIGLVPGAKMTGDVGSMAVLRLENVGAEGRALTGVSSTGWSAILGVSEGAGPGIGGYSALGSGVMGWAEEAPGVWGEANLGPGGYFTSTAGHGVEAYSRSADALHGASLGGGAGVSGVSVGEGPGGYFRSTNGVALIADGRAIVNGDLLVEGPLIGGGHVHEGGDIVDGSIGTPDLADAAVTVAKISPDGASPGQAIVYDGANVTWQAPPGGVVSLRALNVGCAELESFGGTWVKIADLGEFEKALPDSILELTFNGRIGVGAVSTPGARFELRVDDAPTTNGRARASLVSSEAGEAGVPVSIAGIYTGLGAGVHTVSMWVQAASGTGVGSLAWVAPGCWGDTDHVVIVELR
ncbi:MAG: hypothetical protein JXA09_08030 [Anaerolineae bacterium]|nr:hypothetical protein [Anaerolineae bacterium]